MCVYLAVTPPPGSHFATRTLCLGTVLEGFHISYFDRGSIFNHTPFHFIKFDYVKGRGRKKVKRQTRRRCSCLLRILRATRKNISPRKSPSDFWQSARISITPTVDPFEQRIILSRSIPSRDCGNRCRRTPISENAVWVWTRAHCTGALLSPVISLHKYYCIRFIQFLLVDYSVKDPWQWLVCSVCELREGLRLQHSVLVNKG